MTLTVEAMRDEFRRMGYDVKPGVQRDVLEKERKAYVKQLGKFNDMNIEEIKRRVDNAHIDVERRNRELMVTALLRTWVGKRVLKKRPAQKRARSASSSEMDPSSNNVAPLTSLHPVVPEPPSAKTWDSYWNSHKHLYEKADSINSEEDPQATTVKPTSVAFDTDAIKVFDASLKKNARLH